MPKIAKDNVPEKKRLIKILADVRNIRLEIIRVRYLNQEETLWSLLQMHKITLIKYPFTNHEISNKTYKRLKRSLLL